MSKRRYPDADSHVLDARGMYVCVGDDVSLLNAADVQLLGAKHGVVTSLNEDRNTVQVTSGHSTLRVGALRVYRR